MDGYERDSDGTPGRLDVCRSKALRAARTRKIAAMAEWWELQNQIGRGEWVDRKAWEAEAVRKVVTLRNGMLSLARTLAEPLQHKSRVRDQAGRSTLRGSATLSTSTPNRRRLMRHLPLPGAARSA
ncbi:MAG: hypothetical protein R3C45_09235 [Phycisphaerales bacterium]